MQPSTAPGGATTPIGALWVGALDPQPAWDLLADGDFLVVNMSSTS